MSFFHNSYTEEKLPSQKAYTISGVPLLFPYRAYPSQITMMDKIIKCLNKQENCLLESPTGSGKSLALLCAALAWQKKTEKRLQEEELQLNEHLNTGGVILLDYPPTDVQHEAATKLAFEKYKFKKHTDENSASITEQPEAETNFEKFKFIERPCKNNEFKTSAAILLDYPPTDVQHEAATKLAFEKYKFKKHTDENKASITKQPEAETNFEKSCKNNEFKTSATLPSDKMESKYFCGDNCGANKLSPNVDYKNSSTLQYPSDSNISQIYATTPSPQIVRLTPVCRRDETEKKRGITYLDNVDEDADDFQPLKRNKLFSPCTSSFVPDSFNSPDKIDPVRNECSDTPGCKISSSCSSIQDTPSSKKVPGNGNSTLPNKVPKIYFGTRTHKQIGQIIRELKKTPYKDVKMTILSSRERTCIHPQNCKSKNKNEGCDELINRDRPLCDFYKNIRRVSYNRPYELETAFDLEDFVSVCRRKSMCPYFGARELLSSSEIIFCPYNYIVDPLIRSAMNITLKGNIFIMDEAHNIEDSAREAANRTISVTQLQEAISDVLQISQLKSMLKDGDDESVPYKHIAKVLQNIKNWLEGPIDLKDYVSFNTSSKVYSGDEMIAVLDYLGLGPDTFPIFQKNYLTISKNENDPEAVKKDDYRDQKLSGLTNMCINGLVETLNYMYKNSLSFVPDFRVVVIKGKTSEETSMVPFSQSFKRKSFSSATVLEISINFWCLNPAVVFTDMKDVIHSLIVASGTLSPLASFQSELGIPFHITLEANHVVPRENVWVGTIGRGPNNNCLSGTFHVASTFAYQDEIGNIVLEISSVIPYGILCFLPSYGMLNKLVDRWKVTGLFDKLMCKKNVFCEPRRANEDFMQIIQEFYDVVKDCEENRCEDGINGALLFAVCRGKVSEGLDFADNNARAVITIGIPFPNVKDAQVDLKKKYNDIYSSKRRIVSGSDWYEMQAFRALNQALGRCIRHKNDYGALIIVDERFQKYQRYIGALSKWIRKDVEHFPTFCNALNSLCKFTEKMGLIDNSTNNG